MKVHESINVTSDESPLPPKTSPLEDDLVKEEASKVSEKKPLGNDVEDEILEIEEVVNIKECKSHPFENVIGNLNQRTLRSQAQDKSNFFCFLSTIEPKNVGEALKDESWVVAIQEELNQFTANDVWELVPNPTSMTIIGTKNAKKIGLEDSKPMKTPMSSDTKLTKDEESESVDNTKYRGLICSLLYLMASRPDIMFSVCLSARFQEDPKTSHLEAKQTALAISTIEVEYISADKACQQALWIKQPLIDYDICLNDIPIMCDNKGAIDLSKNPVQHSHTKHVEIRPHFLNDNSQKGNIYIEKVLSEENITDILSKPLKREPFNYLRLGLGMIEQIS
ncbi:hypothetical protein Tco_0866448 [Tanacetum coccineum]